MCMLIAVRVLLMLWLIIPIERLYHFKIINATLYVLLEAIVCRLYALGTLAISHVLCAFIVSGSP